MVLVEERDIKTIAVFSEDAEKMYRFYLKKVWDQTKPNIAFLLLNPSKADILKSDNTVTNITNFAIDNDYGSIAIVNLFPDRGTDKSCLSYRNSGYDQINDQYIEEALEEAKEFVIAWERGNTRVGRKRAVTKILKKYPEKLKCFTEYPDGTDADSSPKKVLHPRIIRDIWTLENWDPILDLDKELKIK